MDLLTWSDIIIQIVLRLGPVWVALVILFFVSFRFKRSLGLYGKLFDSTIGMIGFPRLPTVAIQRTRRRKSYGGNSELFLDHAFGKCSATA